MLTITIEGNETYDEVANEFSSDGDVLVHLEHSLLSVSKWESIHQKPFLSSEKKTTEEVLDYIRCMILDPILDPDLLKRVTQRNLEEIQAYIDSTQSATTFGNMPGGRGPGEVITSELIYFWMVSFNIPLECESWHLNRLFSLIRICGIKNSKPKKMSRSELARHNADLNAQRRKEYNTSG